MNKKVALITGSSSGIGREFARIHSANGGDFVIIARRVYKLNELKQELEKKHNVKVKVIAKDLTLPQSPIEIYNEVKGSGIKVDYLINNAGFGGRGYFYERPIELDLQKIAFCLNYLSDKPMYKFEFYNLYCLIIFIFWHEML